MPKNCFPMPTAKKRFQFLIYTPKNMYLKKKKKKKHGLKRKNYRLFCNNFFLYFLLCQNLSKNRVSDADRQKRILNS